MEEILLGPGYDGKSLSLRITKTGFLLEGEVYAAGDEIRRANILFSLPRGERPAFLRAFYVENPREEGLGKKMLCALIRRYSAELAGNTIELEASGGKCSETHVHEESEATLDAFLAKYPQVVKTLEHDANLGRGYGEKWIAPPYEMKAKAVCAIRQNRKLVAYYQTLGFVTVADYGDYEQMRAPTSTVLAACGGVRGGSTRNTRKGRRRKSKRSRVFR